MQAVLAGERELRAVVIASDDAAMIFPCGICRQVLAEFGLDTVVIVADEEGKVTMEMTVGEMLPGAFTPESLVQ